MSYKKVRCVTAVVVLCKWHLSIWSSFRLSIQKCSHRLMKMYSRRFFINKQRTEEFSVLAQVTRPSVPNEVGTQLWRQVTEVSTQCQCTNSPHMHTTIANIYVLRTLQDFTIMMLGKQSLYSFEIFSHGLLLSVRIHINFNDFIFQLIWIHDFSRFLFIFFWQQVHLWTRYKILRYCNWAKILSTKMW